MQYDFLEESSRIEGRYSLHAIEKILARASGRTSVKPGEIVVARVDFAEINDLYPQAIHSFYEIGGSRVWDRDRLAFVFDHYSPAPTIKSARTQSEMRRFAVDNSLTYHFDIGAGVCHQVMPEAGLVLPGDVIMATDSHTTIHGAFGAFGTGVGATDMAVIMKTGELWLRVPEIIGIRITGKPPQGVYSKDVILKILGEIKADGAVYKAIDYYGDYVDGLGVPGRMVLCNMAVEMGAKTAYIQPNAEVMEYAASRAVRPFNKEENDADYKYQLEYEFDVSGLPPMLAAPGGVDNSVSIDDIGQVCVDQCLIGTCTGGRACDLDVAAQILKGRSVAYGTRLIVVPASKEVLSECMENGTIKTLMEAVATIVSPGCGPCLGAHEGVLSPGEVCVTASNRNFPGRMGSESASIYLASPATVAATAVEGRIADPRHFLQENDR